MANAQLSPNWTAQSLNWGAASVGIGDVSIVDANVAWAIGYDGSGGKAAIVSVAKTIDGGATWTVTDLTTVGFSPDADPANIDAISEDVAFIMAYGNSSGATFWKTTDGGASWNQVELLFGATTSFANGVSFFDDNLHGFAHGDHDDADKFELYYTTDGGESWTECETRPDVVDNGEYSFNGPNQMTIFGSTAYIVTNFGRVLKSTDYGVNWDMTTDFQPTGSAYSSVKIFAASADILFARAGTGTGASFAWNDWYRSTDGGATWATFTPTGPMHNSDMCAVPGSANTLISTGAATDDYGVSKSTDAGVTWVEVPFQAGDPLETMQALSCEYLSEDMGYVGQFDYIFRYDSPTAINTVDSKEVKVFPNPTEGVLYLNTKSANVTVTNVMGKVVAKFENVNTIDLSNNAKGLYFVNVSSNGVNTSAKVILK